ncbi:MAG: T9SS type A sorting domain-containing protein, partial [Saprospiraceae bacterium]
DAKIPPLGWLDVTDVAIASVGLTLGVDTMVAYHYFSNVDRQEIAVVRLNNAQSAAEMIQFKNVNNVQLAISNIATTPESCPNANNGSITITATGAGTLTYAISGPANQSNSTGVFTGLPDGNYTATVTSSSSPCPASAMATVGTAVDAAPPTITCPATQTLLLDANCTATLPNYTGMATTGDNCSVQGVTQSPAAGTPVSNGGNMTVTLTVTDASNNTAQCTFSVTKVGSTPPTVVCKNTTVVLGPAGTYMLQSADVFDATASSGSCSGVLTVTNISPAMVTCAQVNQTISVVVTVQDGSGNTATCTAQITVQEGVTQPAGWNSANVGNANGTAGYTACLFNGAFTVSATGFSTASSDVLHLTSQQLCGNGEIIARVMTVNGGGWGGIMIRENLTPGSKKVTLKTQLNSTIRREIRSTTNGATAMLNFNRPQHIWLRLVRSGSTFVGYTSTNGTTWSYAFSATVNMTGCVHAGVFSESINGATTTTATFSNVSVTGPGSNLAAGLPNSELPSENGEQVRVFPNPTTGEVTIDLDLHAGKPGTIQVFNALGALTTQERLIPGNPETHRLRIGDLAGVYTVVIQLEDSRIVRRVVVQSE